MAGHPGQCRCLVPHFLGGERNTSSVRGRVVPVTTSTTCPLPSKLPTPDSTSDYVQYFPYKNCNDFDLPPVIPQKKKASAAARRNAYRLPLRNKKDQKLLSKSHLPNILSDVFGPAFLGPDDEQSAPKPWLLKSISRVAKTTTPAPSAPPFLFSTDNSSVTHNTELLQVNDYDLTRIIEDNQQTTLCYGSEFRAIDDLESIYGRHELFGFFTEMHQQGMEYHYDRDLTESEKEEELQTNLTRGNHNSAKSCLKELETKINREVMYGFALPVWLSALAKIPKAMLQACGFVTQSTLSESGERKEKSWLTHNLSFSITSPYASVNRRLDRDRYPELIYGFCLLHTIHFIVALRLQFPDKPILISQYDFLDAYQRISHRATSTVQTIIALGKIAYIMLVLSFGGSANPQVWCGLSEMLCILSNDIPSMNNWDPDELFCPTQPEVPPPDFLEDTVPYATARTMAVEVPTRSLGRGDCYLDDIIKVYVGLQHII